METCTGKQQSSRPRRAWLDKKDEALAVEWLRQKPSPELVLEFVSCKCKKNKRRNGMCDCFVVGLRCTDICRCLNCANRTPAKDEELREADESGSRDDSSDDDLSADEQN